MEEANNNDQTTSGEYHPNHEVVLYMKIEVEKTVNSWNLWIFSKF
jgi:hypothetical protein